MKELLILLIIGISLSIDAFSISTVIGITEHKKERCIKQALLVGIFHFFMPLFGVILSYKIEKLVNINSNLLLGIILILLSLQMFLEYIKPTDKQINLKRFGLILFAFGVSIDSFTVGLGLKAITNNILLASTIFSLCSFSFTFLGLTLGKYISKILKKYSYIFGTILLFILGIYFLCKIF